jgi:anti-anti-sigma factor
MEIHIVRRGAVIVSLSGRMDAVTYPGLLKEVMRLMEEGEKNFVLDCSALEYMSSSGLRSIFMIYKELKGRDGKLALACLKDVVKEAFFLSGSGSIFPVFETVDSAFNHVI